MSYPTIPLNYDLTLQRWVISADGQFVTAQQQFVRGENPTFAVSFIAGATGSKAVVNLGTVTAWAFCIKRANLYPTANLVYTTTATATGSGTSSLYSFSPDCSGVELTDAFVILDDDLQELADNGQLPTLPADQAARYALTGLSNGYIVRQVDTGTYWIVIDEDELDNSAGWSSQVPMRDYVDSALQIDFAVAGVKDKTRALPCRITNDYTMTVAPTTSAADAFVRVNATTDVLTSPTAAEFYAANPPTGGGGTSDVGNTVTVDAVFGDDDTGEREGLPFLTIVAALAVAVSGDTVVIRPGTYNETGNILKNGVNLYCYPGVHLNNSLTEGSELLFDDSADGANGPVVCSITGFPALDSDFSSNFNITNAGTNIFAQIAGGNSCEITQTNGTLTIDSIGRVARMIYSKGNLTFRAGQLAEFTSTISNSANADNVDVQVDFIGGITIDGANSATRFWFDCIRNDGSLNMFNNARVYFRALKSAYGFRLRQTGSVSDYYIEAQKMTGIALPVIGAIIELQGGKSEIHIGKIDRSYTGIGTDVSIRCSGGTHNVVVGTLQTNASGSDSMVVSGGTLNLSIDKTLDDLAGTSNLLTVSGGSARLCFVNHVAVTSGGVVVSGGTLRVGCGAILNTSAVSTAYPITKSGGTLIVEQGAVLVSDSSKNSIYAATAQNVISYGHFAKYAKHANVTLLVGSETVSTDIV